MNKADPVTLLDASPCVSAERVCLLVDPDDLYMYWYRVFYCSLPV